MKIKICFCKKQERSKALIEWASTSNMMRHIFLKGRNYCRLGLNADLFGIVDFRFWPLLLKMTHAQILSGYRVVYSSNANKYLPRQYTDYDFDGYNIPSTCTIRPPGENEVRYSEVNGSHRGSRSERVRSGR